MKSRKKENVARLNYQSAPASLYDMPFPTAPNWLAVRKAIEDYRDGYRDPVSFSP